MPTSPPANYLVIDAAWRVVGAAMRLQEAEALEVEHRTATGASATQIVDLHWSDVASLAIIAERDMPALARKGQGFLGAGTHVAQPYLEAMRAMAGVTRDNVKDVQFGYDRADRIVITFLSNAATWKGDTARAVKAALKAMVA